MMKVLTSYVLGKPKTEIYQTGNDFYYDGTIYKLPNGSFNPVIRKNDLEESMLFFFGGNNEIVVGIFVDTPDDLEKTDWTFEEIPPEYYETCPIVEVESTEAVIENTESSAEETEWIQDN
jgi:hypothetical protein